MIKIISLGGGIINPDKINIDYIKNLRNLIFKWVKKSNKRKIILITGGGKIAREYQDAYKQINPKFKNHELDKIGIMATKLNATLIKKSMQPLCIDNIVSDPTQDFHFKGQILVASGWKAGFSTDYITVKLAEKFKSDEIINLTNVSQIYDKDPNKFDDAKGLKNITWKELQDIVGKNWEPGSNLPFDPIATKLASKLSLKAYVLNGMDLQNLKKVFDKNDDFLGTIVVK
ncbi:UMP kinase [Borrelia miyamotoi]|uniref:Uridylate kinase n=1 Tax=Borrelia miyamotoi TaxID=47466 RepID=A0AAX3JMF3_9SPIR|nr:UMP kinase [Borrelia miyamotoi]QFP41783.1 UMP kinase [Borrelia miyamotoi]QFP47903.1 UMP kinase [Borrelia miyamotoi]QGT55663.1 UMP kinase [Borrelia miyamotoi]QGT56446.1 UMP kinase [Borrelia miyamotoi]WAZ71691.1 UMP kinase [Borrelia miyamotoi]